MASKPWTIAELNKAIGLHEQGLTATEIGEMLNRPRGGVIAVFKVNGIEMRRGRPPMEDPWAEYEERVAKQAHIGSSKLLAAIQIAGLRP
jgi:hypothetical protein